MNVFAFESVNSFVSPNWIVKSAVLVLPSDAVAVAGRGVAQRNRRRAVVLILGENPTDVSGLSAKLARQYLATVHVPLVVWSTDPQGGWAQAGWGEPRDISSVTLLEREVKALTALLDRQRIVWLEGFHLPQMISLAADARGLAFAM